MKKGCIIVAIIITIMCVVATQCTATGKKIEIDGIKTHVETYGLFNQDVHKNDRVVYEVSAGSVIFSIILCETVVVPVYLIGFDLYQPVKVKEAAPIKK